MSIECDFERKPAYVYSTDDDQTIEDEVEAARLAGIDAEFTTDTKLPFPVNGAVRVPRPGSVQPAQVPQGNIKGPQGVREDQGA